jgi:hypothetical protein
MARARDIPDEDLRFPVGSKIQGETVISPRIENPVRAALKASHKKARASSEHMKTSAFRAGRAARKRRGR